MQRDGHDRVQVEVAEQPASRFGMVGVEAGPVFVGDDPPLPYRLAVGTAVRRS